jgi:hypothetical protein
MRLRLIAVTLGFLLVSAPLYASGISYAFTGTLSSGSTLTLADQTVIDLSLAAFTATGVTGDVLGDPNAWYATTTYDFGSLGTFTTDANGDEYVQFLTAVDPSHVTGTIGLASWHGLPFTAGFEMQIGTLAVDTVAATPTGFVTSQVPLGDFTPISSDSTDTRQLTNADGQTFTIGGSENFIHHVPLTITAAHIIEAPEPATLMLLALGSAILRRRVMA